MSRPLLTFTDVSFAETLSGLNFILNRGEFLVVLGADTRSLDSVAMMAAGLESPDRGDITWSMEDECSARTGLVFSVPGQGLIAATVLEEVRSGLEWQGMTEEEIAARTRDSLCRLGLWELRRQSPSNLSGGEKQRLAMAAVLALDPACLVLNDPASMLDSWSLGQVVEAARGLVREGRSVLWLTGDLAQAAVAERVLVLAGGSAVWEGQPGSLLIPGHVLPEWGLGEHPLAVMTSELIDLGLPLPGKAETIESLVEEICSVWPVSV